MDRRIVIMCQPIYGVVPGLADAKQKEWMTVNMAKGLLNGYFCRVGAYIDEARNHLVARALDETPATHVFFADQDMIHPLGCLGDLLAADTEAVSGLYFDKSERHLPVGWSSIDPATVARMESFAEDTLQPVAGFGMGAMLLKTSLLREMADKFGDREWFRSERGGEDLHFCRRAAEMGVEIFLDARVQCGHVKDEVITIDHWRAAKALREKAG